MSFKRLTERMFLLDGDSGAGGGGGDPQNSQDPEKGKTQSNNGEGGPDLSKTLADLQAKFDDYQKKTNEELKSRRLEVKRLMATLSGKEEGAEGGAAGNQNAGNQGENGESAAALATATNQLQASQAEIAKLQAQLLDLTKRLHVERVARVMGFLHEEDVYPLIPGESITQDDQGKLLGVEEALKALVTKYPALVGTKQKQGNPPNYEGGGSGGGSPKEKERELRSRYNI